MALSFPFAIGSFADQLRMTTVRWRLVADQQISGLGGGKIIVADLAPKYWEAEVSLINMENRDARRIQALIEALDEGMNDFYLYDPRCAFPITDPTGSIFGAATVQINTLNANNKELTLKGVPATRTLSAGDMFHLDFGSPAKRALHRIVVGATANGSGITPSLEVRPHILPGAAVDAAVTLIKPSARVKMIPGSFEPGTARQMMTTGLSFKARQVF
jgi:hypothetical protein